MKSSRFFAAFLSMALAATALFTSAAAEAKQCVFNKGGYVLEVQWYRQIDMAKQDGVAFMMALAPPVQSDTLSAGFGSCTKTDEVLTLVAGVVGCLNMKMYGTSANCQGTVGFTENGMPAVLYSQSSSGSGPVFYDPATRIYGAKKILSRITCLAQANCMASFQLPKSNTVWIAVPSTTQYLDFWGTTFDAQWGPGGAIK